MFSISTLYRNKKMQDVDFYVIGEKKQNDEVISYYGFWVKRSSKTVLESDSLPVRLIKFKDWEKVSE